METKRTNFNTTTEALTPKEKFDYIHNHEWFEYKIDGQIKAVFITNTFDTHSLGLQPTLSETLFKAMETTDFVNGFYDNYRSRAYLTNLDISVDCLNPLVVSLSKRGLNFNEYYPDREYQAYILNTCLTYQQKLPNSDIVDSKPIISMIENDYAQVREFDTICAQLAPIIYDFAIALGREQLRNSSK